MKDIHLFSDTVFSLHDTGGGHHPEVPGRLTVIRESLAKRFVGMITEHAVGTRADWSLLLEAHEESYLLRFEETALSGRSWLDHRDNALSYDTYDAALTAAAAGPQAVDLVEKEEGEAAAFCLVRPPGHHAEGGRAMGFCFINNAVVAVRHWQAAHGRRRVAVVDWDAHHGNGIQHSFERDGDVLYVSLHEHPTFSFPGTGYGEERGTGDGEGTTVNIPLRPGAGDGELLGAVEGPVSNALAGFRPDGIVIAAGFDGHKDDDMSGLALSTDCYGKLGEAARNWASELCGGRIITLLEGGYHLPVLGDSAAAYVAGLAGEGL